MGFRKEDVAWAAGLFEGEGCVNIARNYWTRKGEKRSRPTPQCKLVVSMTDREPVEKFAAIFGGRVNGPYQYGKKHYKPFWSAQIDSPPAVKSAAQAMYPYLSPRRQGQIEVIYSPKI